MKGIIYLTLTVVILCTLAFAAKAKIQVDGKLDEPEWQQAQVFTDYVQSFPDTGEKPAYPTTTYLLSRPEGIYVGFINQQAQRSRAYSGHDQFTSSDFNMLFIDFNGDGNSAYEFVATLGGGTMDGTYSRGNNSNRDWDGNWQVAVSEQGDYWYSEFFIPWSVATYKANTAAKRRIKVYFQRNNVVAGEAYSLPDTNRSRKDFTYRFLPIEVDVGSDSYFSFTPYLSYQHAFNQQNNDLNAGLDMVYQPSGNQQWIASLNPDFGQIESDELIVNYSAIETLRTDKRPFFTYNQSVFDLRGPNNMRLLNTRRIGGLAKNGRDIHDILAAAKYIYSGDWLDAGVLAVQEQDANNSQGKRFVSARWQHANHTFSVGQLVNFVDDPARQRRSWVNNVDSQYRLNDKVSVFANWMTSHVEQDQQSNTGMGATLSAHYNPQRHWLNTLELSYLGDKLDINDAGYLARNNLRKWLISSQYDDYQFTGNSAWRRFRYFAQVSQAHNNQGDKLADDLQTSITAQLKSKHSMRITFQHKGSGVDDLIRRGAGKVYLPAKQRWDLFYSSPSPAPFSYSITASRLQEGISDWAERLALTTRSYFTDQIRLDLNATYLDSPDWVIGRADGNVNQYARRLNQVSAKLVSKLSAQSDLTINAQWFALKAKGLQQLDPQTFGCCSFNNQSVNDFAVTRLALQARYRLRFGTGAQFFLVYTRNGFQGYNNLNQGFEQLFQDAWQRSEQNHLTAKLSYPW